MTHPPGRVSLPTQAGWDQLVFAQSGAFTASSAARAWTVPVHRGLCVPDGTRLRIETSRRSAIRCLYLDAGLEVFGGEVRVVNLNSLTRELLKYAIDSAPMDLRDRADAALVTLLSRQIMSEPEAPLHLPLPTDPAAQSVATSVISDPSGGLEDMLSRSGASRRTIERRFREETSMSFGQWRRRSRVLSAVSMLAEGDSVTRVALRVGYSSPSAIVAAFRSEFEASPREFIRSSSRT